MLVTRIEPLLLSTALTEPVRMSFGQLAARTALLVRVEADQGLTGLGEIWSNFPSWYPWEKLRWLRHVASRVIGREVGDPAAVWRQLKKEFEILALQAGVPGLMYQVMSGIDLALWDLAAQAAGVPLYRFLGGDRAGPREVAVYASGIGPHVIPAEIERWTDEGIGAFKLKVGFGQETDQRNARVLRDLIGPDRLLMLDANQAWSLSDAVHMAGVLRPFGPFWVEEPIRADDLDALVEFRKQSRVRVAIGENLYGLASLVRAVDAGCVDVVQPDVTKTSGFTEAIAVARFASERGTSLAPHSFGGAIGLIASAHLIAATGSEAPLELDVNPNPLRDALLVEHPQISDGRLILPDAPGLGVRLRLDTVARTRVECPEEMT